MNNKNKSISFTMHLVIFVATTFNPLVKSALRKNNFLISQPKLMLRVLKRIISMRDLSRGGSFEHPKHMLKLWVRKYLQFYTEFFCLS